MKAISFSLFGYDRARPKDCFDFYSYLRGMMVNVRINRLLYPDWISVIHTDKETYNSKYQPVFDWLLNKGLIELVVCASDEALTKAMLWRLKPCFERVWDEAASGYRGWKYTHVICRDIDSIGTYREAQAVTMWMREKKTIHCITDSVSHNVPMMGGMIGIATDMFSQRLGVETWDSLMAISRGINFENKGADQDFLNRYVYPKFADSATEHFILGMVRNLAEGNGRHYSIEDIPLPIDAKYKELNSCAGHIGAAGYYDSPTVRFLNHIDPFANEYKAIEEQFPNLFLWRG